MLLNVVYVDGIAGVQTSQSDVIYVVSFLYLSLGRCRLSLSSFIFIDTPLSRSLDWLLSLVEVFVVVVIDVDVALSLAIVYINKYIYL